MVEIDRIRSLAKEKGISIASICRKFDISRGYLNDVESGKNALPEGRLEVFADILGTTTDYLHGKTDEKNKPSEIGELTTEESKMLDIYRNFTEEQKKEFWIGLAEKK